ncbi:MAG: MerR family DNA-binding transcriptional regulator [Solirubrobacterales bacterium]
MSTGIRTNAAAEILGVSPNTLRSWERRFGYPKPKRTPGNHRQYELVELQTLRDALAETGNISTAIELSRQRQSAPASSSSLQAAFESFDEDSANRAMEESLALRPLERSIEELLLPTLDGLAAEPERVAELEFACRWATGWLHGARRLAPPASRPAGILLLEADEASGSEAVHAQALDLALRRTGFRVLALSSDLREDRLERALAALDPTAIVLCGPKSGGESASRLLRRIRGFGVQAPLYAFRIPGLASDDGIPVAEIPSQITQALNTDLRRRAATAFA